MIGICVLSLMCIRLDAAILALGDILARLLNFFCLCAFLQLTSSMHNSNCNIFRSSVLGLAESELFEKLRHIVRDRQDVATQLINENLGKNMCIFMYTYDVNMKISSLQVTGHCGYDLLLRFCLLAHLLSSRSRLHRLSANSNLSISNKTAV